jgi:hypothetical protein
MWYRIAVDLSNLKGFSPVETSVSDVEEKPLTERPLHQSVTKFHEGRDEVDNVLQFGGLDSDSPFIVDYAEKLLVLIGEVVPALEGILDVIEQGHTLKWINFILLRFTSANWVIEDTKNFISLCNKVKGIEDPRERVDTFISGIRKIDGLYGFIANSVMIFNTIVKGLKEFAGLDIDNKWTFMAYFYGAPIAKYLFEETGDDEDKSGLKVIKKRVINPSLNFLFEKNLKSRDLYKYVIELMDKNQNMTHEQVRDNALKYYGDRLKKEDIVELVDLVYEDPHDAMGVLRGRRISKRFYDNFNYLMSNSGTLQMHCLKASMSLGHMLDWLTHIKIANDQNRKKLG